MAYRITQQYRPIQTTEQADADALSVRFMRDTADNINNAVGAVMLCKLAGDFYPGVINTSPYTTTCMSVDANASENVIRMWAPVWVPSHFNRLVWFVGGKQVRGSGDSCIWRLYASGRMYSAGPLVFDDDYLGDYDSASVTLTSTTHSVPAGQYIDVKRSLQGDCYLLLTAQNATALDQQCMLTTCDVWAVV